MVNKKDLSKIGIGTWGIGGFAERNPKNNDEKQIDALKYTLDKGINYAEICNWYSEGRAAEIFKQALDVSSKKREDIFISLSLYQHRNPTLKDVQIELEKMQKLFSTQTFDAILVTFSGLKVWGINESINLLHSFLEQKFARYISITNSNFDMLKNFKKDFGDNFFAHELSYNFEIRENKDFGIVDYANENNIKNVVWQPIRRNKTLLRNWSLLAELSDKYGKTQNQIILSWLISEGFLPLVKSENINHIDENLEAMTLTLDNDDLKKLNEFRPPNWKSPKIDWDKTGDGISISKLPDIFDEEYNKQNGL